MVYYFKAIKIGPVSIRFKKNVFPYLLAGNRHHGRQQLYAVLHPDYIQRIKLKRRRWRENHVFYGKYNNKLYWPAPPTLLEMCNNNTYLDSMVLHVTRRGLKERQSSGTPEPIIIIIVVVVIVIVVIIDFGNDRKLLRSI